MNLLYRLFRNARRSGTSAGYDAFHRIVSGDTLWIAIDLTGHIFAVSKAVEVLTGRPEAQLIGSHPDGFLLFVGEHPRKEAELLHAIGKPRRFRVTMGPLKSLRGKHIGFVLFLNER